MTETPKEITGNQPVTHGVMVQRFVKQRPTGRADKYSLNLHMWLRKQHEHYLGAFFSPWSSVDGSMDYSEKAKRSPSHIYIGWLDEDGYLMGSMLAQIICNGTKAQTWAFAPKLAFEELPNFWEEYDSLGKCSFDPDHCLYFNRERYVETGDGKRVCLWCGRKEILHVFEEVVTREKWLAAV